jgi:hypothetical protein
MDAARLGLENSRLSLGQLRATHEFETKLGGRDVMINPLKIEAALCSAAVGLPQTLEDCNVAIDRGSVTIADKAILAYDCRVQSQAD